MCGWCSSILHKWPLVETNNLYVDGEWAKRLIVSLNKYNTPHSLSGGFGAWRSLMNVLKQHKIKVKFDNGVSGIKVKVTITENRKTVSGR